MSTRTSTPNDTETLRAIGFEVGVRADRIRAGEREPISRLVRQLVYRRDNWSCQFCHARYNASLAARRSGPLHLDHITPWSAGGSDRSDNLRTLCGPCNQDRSNYVDPKRDVPTMPIVPRCTWCFCTDDATRPDTAFDVYCGSHNGTGWAIPGWSIL